MQKSQPKTEEAVANKSIKKAIETRSTILYKCRNCGTAYSECDKFCSECGMSLKGNSCIYCGAATKPNYEICPDCGKNLQAELCSFCGCGMEIDNSFCPECGNPRTGIICGECQTVNYRNFCRKCNAPLNELAQSALAAANADPIFQKTLALAGELTELEELLRSQSNEESEQPELPEISEENRKLIDQYKEILSTFRGQKPQETTESPVPKAQEPEAKPQINFSIRVVNREEATAKYKEKLAEMQAALSSMIPDAGMTPHLQRDYYSARKVEIITKTKSRNMLYWLCNAYGCIHNKPNECAEPFKGGTWIYGEVNETTSIWVNNNDKNKST